jgi:hypothetical protein
MKKTTTFALPVRMLCMLMLAIALVFTGCPNPSGGDDPSDTYSVSVARLSVQGEAFGTVAITKGAASGNASGATIKVKATPASGYSFVGWLASDNETEKLVSTKVEYDFLISADTALYALFIQGTGTEGDPLRITNLAQLRAIDDSAEGMGFHYILDADLSGMDETLMNGTTAFTGEFDGNGHSIGLLIATGKVDGNITYAGLFAKLDTAGKVKNLELSGQVYISASTVEVRAGAVAGQTKGTVSAVRSSVAVTGVSSGGFLSVGGLAGYQDGGTISNCYSIGEVKVPDTTTTTTVIYAGGIVGRGASGTVSYCYATGNVSAGEATDNSPNISVGGITGVACNLSYCVVLQSALSASGDNSLISVRRVFAGSSGGSASNNYAQTMTVTASGNGDVNSQTDATTNDASKAGGGNFTNSGKTAWTTSSGGPGWTIADSGGSEAAPWLWDSASGRPKLWWE